MPSTVTPVKLFRLDYQLCRQVTDGSLNNNRGGRLAMMEIGICNLSVVSRQQYKLDCVKDGGLCRVVGAD